MTTPTETPSSEPEHTTVSQSEVVLPGAGGESPAPTPEGASTAAPSGSPYPDPSPPEGQPAVAHDAATPNLDAPPTHDA